MKRTKQMLAFLLLVTVMGVCGLFGKSSAAVSAEAATEQQTETPGESSSDTEEIEYEGLAEAPGIIKFIFFSLILAAVFVVVGIIYCAVTPMHRKRWK